MNPCKECMKVYGKTLCDALGHCAFEGTDVTPMKDQIIETTFIEQRQIV